MSYLNTTTSASINSIGAIIFVQEFIINLASMQIGNMKTDS